MQSQLKGAAAPVALIAALASQPAFAQDGAVVADPAVQASDASEEEGPAIIVTGSRISRPDLESTVPIASIEGESLIQQGNTLSLIHI